MKLTFKDRINLWFHHNECIHATIITETRKRKEYIIRLSTEQNTFKPTEKSEVRFKIDYDLVVIDELGLPSFTYYYNNPNPIDYEMSRAVESTSAEFDDVFNTKIIEQLHNANKKQEEVSTNRLVIIFGLINIFAILIVGYIVYNGFEELGLSMEEIKEFIELIRNALITNGEL